MTTSVFGPEIAQALDAPDYIAELLDMAGHVQTEQDVLDLWYAAKRVFPAARNARVRTRQLRLRLQQQAVLLQVDLPL